MATLIIETLKSSKTGSEIEIIAGQFALVESGNATCSLVIDDEHVQDRANKALHPYFGNNPKIFSQGHKGVCLRIKGHEEMLGNGIYKDIESAKRNILK